MRGDIGYLLKTAAAAGMTMTIYKARISERNFANTLSAILQQWRGAKIGISGYCPWFRVDSGDER